MSDLNDADINEVRPAHEAQVLNETPEQPNLTALYSINAEQAVAQQRKCLSKRRNKRRLNSPALKRSALLSPVCGTVRFATASVRPPAAEKASSASARKSPRSQRLDSGGGASRLWETLTTQ